MPGRQVHLADGAFVIQRRKPVDSLHRAGGQPTLENVGQRVRIAGVLDSKDFHSFCPQLLCQFVCYTAFVGHHNHAATWSKLHSSRFAQLERWTQDRHRYAARNAVCCIEARHWRARGRDHRGRSCYSSCRGRCCCPLFIFRELNHMRQGWKVAQLEVLIARNVVGRPYGGEHLRLLDGVDA